jgi:hypothetical protein
MKSRKELTSYLDYRDHIERLMKATSVKEGAGAAIAARTIDERLAQCIWYDHLLKSEGLRTDSGKTLDIVHSGRWNEEKGPDFRAAEMRIGGEAVKGDVEIHLNSGDWEAHGHHRDFEYNGVRLHAFLYRTDEEKFDVLHNGERLERFEMQHVLFPDLETIRRTVSLEDYPYSKETGVGRCAPVMQSLETDFLERFFDLAGRERMEEKIRRFQLQLPGEGYEQVFYQALMTAMGYKGSKTLFFLLSKRAPLAELVDYSRGADYASRVAIVQAILLNVANLVPKKDTGHPFFDDETMAYINDLNRHWAELSGYFRDRMIPPDRKWFASVRPVNFAPRRIAGISHLIAQGADAGKLFHALLEMFAQAQSEGSSRKSLLAFIRRLENFLTVDREDYWAHRYLFTTPRLTRQMSLIGESRARSVAFNSLLPMVLVRARESKDAALEEFCWHIFDVFPPLSENVVVKFMRHRLFGTDVRAKNLLNGEKRQQALFKIFGDCCNNNEVTCDDCQYLRDLR